MYLLNVSRWILTRLLQQPISWFWFVACLALWPAVVVFSPVQLALTPDDASGTAYEVGLLTSLGGSGLVLSTLGDNRWILDQAGRGRRLAARGLGLIVGGTFSAGISLLLPAVLGSGLSFAWGPIVVALLLTALHLAGLGMVLWALPMTTAVRSLLLPILAWVLPAWLDSRDLVGGFLLTLVRVDKSPDWLRESNPTELASALAPMVALWLGATLIEGGRSPVPTRRA